MESEVAGEAGDLERAALEAFCQSFICLGKINKLIIFSQKYPKMNPNQTAKYCMGEKNNSL